MIQTKEFKIALWNREDQEMTEHPQGAKLTFWMKEKAEVVRGENLTTRRMARKEGRPATAAVTWARRGTGVEGFTTAEESAMCFLGILPTTPPPHHHPNSNYCYLMCSTVTLINFPSPAFNLSSSVVP